MRSERRAERKLVIRSFKYSEDESEVLVGKASAEHCTRRVSAKSEGNNRDEACFRRFVRSEVIPDRADRLRTLI